MFKLKRAGLKNKGFIRCSILSVSLFINILIFHYYINGVLTDYVGTGFVDTLHYYIKPLLPKISISLILGCAAFCIKRRRSLFAFAVVLDTWISANVLYYFANNLFIDVDVLCLSGNLTDISVLKSCFPGLIDVLPYYIITCIAFLILYIIEKKFILETSVSGKKQSFIVLVTAILLQFCYYLDDWRSCYYIQKLERQIQDELFMHKSGVGGWKYFVPFHATALYAEGNCFNQESHWQKVYISNNSIFHFLPAIFVYNFFYPSDEDIVLSDQDVEPYIIFSEKPDTINKNLIIVLVESLESWPINGEGQLSDITPNLNSFVKSEHVLYCNKIKSEVKNGVSGDGQLIVNTGLLPTQRGAACHLYGDNVYPNFAHSFHNSAIINPWPEIWNQNVVTYSYGYDSIIQPSEGRWADKETFKQLADYVNTHEKYCILTITMSTHLPFNNSEFEKHTYDRSMPSDVGKYLDCLSYTDRCLGEFLKKMQSKGNLDNSTIIITGDHTVFKKGILPDLLKINGINKDLISEENTFCPLIIYDTSIEGNVLNNNVNYQMDIYPTILDIIGLSNYYWRGFGNSVLNNNKERKCDEQQAYKLSDKLIRTNYFSKYQTSQYSVAAR